jgi:glucokinase
MNEKSTFLDKATKTWIGVDIGGTKTAVVLSSQPPSTLARIEFPTCPEQGPERAINLIKQAIQQVISSSAIDLSTLAGIGVSCGGPLDPVMGVIQSPPNLATWVNVPITSILQCEFFVDCRLENDANAGAVAEHRFGAGRGTRHMIFLTMGTGLGAGIIADGRLYRGASEMAGEIGHVGLTSFGPIGYNKVGSVEGWASGGGMAQVATSEVAAAIKRGEATILSGTFHDNEGLTAKDVADAAQQGDELAKQIIHSTGIRLGEALAILVDILNPERIVIGGLAMRLGDSILGPARLAMQREALAPSAAVCQIVPATLGEQIGDIAAICVAMGF